MSNLVSDLLGKVAIVTGGADGIGFEISKTLAINNADIVIADIRKEQGENAAALIREMGRNAIAIQTDVSDKMSVDKMVKAVLSFYKNVDILVNNAGINIRKPFIEYEEDEFEKIIAVNMKGVFWCCQAVGKIMIKQKKGKVINISSVLERIGQELRGPYAASKGAVAQLTKVLAIEWALYNINVNCVAPGFIKTSLTATIIKNDPDFESFIKKIIPMGHVGNTQDVAAAVLYLASEASDYLTGQSIFVDGGWTIS